MPRLSREVQRFVVTRLAAFDSPADIVKAVHETFGVKVSRGQVWGYDASKSANEGRISAELVELFNTVREKTIEEVDHIGISHLAVRLAALDRIAQKAEEAGFYGTALQALEQAARDAGGMYSRIGPPAGRSWDDDDEPAVFEMKIRRAGAEAGLAAGYDGPKLLPNGEVGGGAQ